MSARFSLLFVSNLMQRQSGKFCIYCKRCCDLLLSLVLLIILGVPFIVIAALISLESAGSPLFVQARVGIKGRRFRMLKFRSMYVDADTRLPDPEIRQQFESTGRILKLCEDPRVTRVGKLLRVTSMDELPQLINVLLGDMSLVGPRALIPSMVDPYPEWSNARHIMQPGITGLWQVSARERNESLADMIEYDLEYVRKWSLWSDFIILCRTPGVVLSRKGAV